MSKTDELKKEAEEYAEQCYGWCNNEQITDVAIATYITSAESREKRIEELEKKLEETEKDLADYQFNYPTIKELETENNKLLDVINNQDVKIADLEKENKKLDRALITSTKNNIERQKIIDSLQAEKEKEKMQIIANCSDKEEGLRRKIFKLEQQIEKMKCCGNCEHRYFNHTFAPVCNIKNGERINNPLFCKCDKWEIKE